MKKYILTIMYNEDSDTVEYIQEEIVAEEELKVVLNDETIAHLTSEDMQLIMESKEHGKA